MNRSTTSLMQMALVAVALSAPTANGVNGSVGNSSPTAAAEGWPHAGNPRSRSVPTYNGVNANVGNVSPGAAIEHVPRKGAGAR